jgi:secreted Zn-dependent insulinase-like peptidase
MSTLRIETQVTTEQLLAALDQMSQAEFEQFAEHVLALRLRRNPTVLAARESELLQGINQGLPSDLRQRYHELIAKRDAGTLSTAEHAELLQLTDQVEQREAERLEQLVALAALRQVTVPQLMHDLGIMAPDDD